MSALAHLRRLASGRRPVDDGLLGNSRCLWGGTELLGEEAILAAFARQPLNLDGDIRAIETAQGGAMIGSTHAIYADFYDGRIARLWRVGGAPPSAPEPAVDVAFDADMQQKRGTVSFRAEDHPCLDTAAAARLVQSAQTLVEEMRLQGELRVRGFVVRACGDGTASAALMALYTLSDEPRRVASTVFGVVYTGAADDVVSAVDPAQLDRWTPRL